MCYQLFKAKGEVGKSWQARKGQKSSSKFKGARGKNFKNSMRSSVRKQFGRNHQRTKWSTEERPTEASRKHEQGEISKPPL